MRILNLDYFQTILARGPFSAKLVFNEDGAIFFPADREHREQKSPGVSYEDDYKGNALAAMISSGRIEIRYHKAFTDQRVSQIVRQLADSNGLASIKSWQVSYQGRPVKATD